MEYIEPVVLQGKDFENQKTVAVFIAVSGLFQTMKFAMYRVTTNAQT